MDLTRVAATDGRAASLIGWSAAVAALITLAGCGTPPRSTWPGGSDGPATGPIADLQRVPDASPQIEPIRIGGPNKPYAVDGRSYTPFVTDIAWRETGLASWYGRKFHGRGTATGETYDMFAMTAAHRTMPLPSYARVRNPANGREVIVRVNDRGPFVPERVIDLSYAAAGKLGLLGGVAPVEIERITIESMRDASWRNASADRRQSAGVGSADPLGDWLRQRAARPSSFEQAEAERIGRLLGGQDPGVD